jgi:hypothetical protein
MPFEIKILFDDGTTITESVFNDSNGQRFKFVYNKKPIKIYFDPGNNILLKEIYVEESANGIIDD